MSIDVDVLTGEVVTDALTAEQARDLTEQIAAGIAGIWQLVKAAYNGRAWLALGYASWDDYCGREFGGSRIALPREDRPEVVASLRDAGLSIRAIASATGSSRGTVQRDLASGVPNGTPDAGPSTPDVAGVQNRTPDAPQEPDVAPKPKPVTGTDGKKYAAEKPKPSLVDDLRDNDDEAMKRHLHKTVMSALVGFTDARKLDPVRVARALPDRDNQRVIDLLDMVENWLAAYREALNGDVAHLRSVK